MKRKGIVGIWTFFNSHAMAMVKQEKAINGPLKNVNQVIKRATKACNISELTVVSIRNQEKTAERGADGKPIVTTLVKKSNRKKKKKNNNNQNRDKY